MRRVPAGLAAVAVVTACAEPAADAYAPVLAGAMAYGCAGGASLVVDYQPGEEPPAITINVDGRETLLLEPDTGALQRWSWPSDGSHHIWELAGGIGTLRYRDGEAGTTTTELTECRARRAASPGP